MDRSRVVNNFFDELMVVLVLYKMEIHNSPAVISLTTALQSIQQTTSVFIYDNSPAAHTHTLNENWQITYRHDANNPGVSKAYNEGFKCAKAQNKNWMLLADQDTSFEKDFFIKIREGVEAGHDQKLIVPIMIDQKGIVSPFHFHFGRGFRLKNISAGKYQLTEKKFINSGLLISRKLFEVTRGFDERYKLDFSDLAFIERLKSLISVFSVIDSTCTHSLFATKDSSPEIALVRFKIYCDSANLLGNQTGNFWVLIWKHLRAIAFSIKYFNWHFIQIAFACKND